MRIIASSIALLAILGTSARTVFADYHVGFSHLWGGDDDGFSTTFSTRFRHLEVNDDHQDEPRRTHSSHFDVKEASLRGHRRLVTLKVGDFSVSGCSPTFSTISDALASTTASDITIKLCAGVFDESVTVSTPGVKLKIKGQGRGVTTLRAPPGSQGVVLALSGTEVILENLTLDGNNKLVAPFPPIAPPFSPFVFGFLCFECDGEAKEVDIVNVESPIPGGNPWDFLPFPIFPSFGVFARSSTPFAGNRMKIKECSVSGIGAVGLFIDGAGLEAEVVKNTINGADSSDIFNTNGIQLSRQAKAIVKKNIIINFAFPALQITSVGIQVLCPREGTEITKNMVGNCDIGIGLSSTSAVKGGKNVVSDVEGGFVVELRDAASDCPAPIVSSDNEVRDNTITSSILGILIRSDGFPGTMTGSILEGNYIQDSSLVGISVAFGEDGEIKKNRIKGSEKDGFVVSGGSGYLIIKNEIDESDETGVLVNGTATAHSFEKNDIETSGLYGIWISNATATDNVFKKNEISDSGVAGILDEGTGTVFMNNNVH